MPARTGGSAVILALGVELLAVGLFTLIAGTSSDVGSIVVLMMVAFWIIYLVGNAKVITGLDNALRAVTTY